jgi:hypothetical protein
MPGPSIRGVKAEYTIAFSIGVLFLAIGVYAAYYFFTTVLPSGKISPSLPLAIVGCSLFGLLMILKSYSIFIPLKKDSQVQHIVCPSCGAMVDEDAEVCEKCKRPLEGQH